MNTPSSRDTILLRLLLLLSVVLLVPASLIHGAEATGVVEGRVFSPASGEYLAQARVTVEGTSLEAFTDADGRFRLPGVAAGAAKVRVAYSGFAALTEVVTVAAGEVTRREFSLALGDRGVVKLDEFVISSSREMKIGRAHV